MITVFLAATIATVLCAATYFDAHRSETRHERQMRQRQFSRIGDTEASPLD